MSGDARVDRKFHKHPKVQKCSLEAIGLWTLVNSYCRDHRKSGSFNREDALRFGPAEVIDELVNVGLWDAEGPEITFHDYRDHNGDDGAGTTAFRMVRDSISSEHPSLVRNQLISEVTELLESGHHPSDVRQALKIWDTKPGIGPKVLPHLISDAVRERFNQANGGSLLLELSKAYRSGDVAPLEKFGFLYVQPDIPENVRGVDAVKSFVEKDKREWIKNIKDSL